MGQHVGIEGSSVVVMFGMRSAAKLAAQPFTAKEFGPANDNGPKDPVKTVTVRKQLEKSGVAIKIKVPVTEYIGVAVSTDRGLIVPVLRDADRMGFADIEKAVAGFAERARSGTITLEELTGGTFSITNGGVFGSLLSTPIVNAPQSAILGMHKIQQRPVAAGEQVVVRPMMYVALTYDHRIVDGREAVQFLVHVKDLLEDPARLLLEI